MEITIPVKSLVTLFDMLVFAGPKGPVAGDNPGVSAVGNLLAWVALNPQPLPPGVVASLLEVAGPTDPIPWRMAPAGRWITSQFAGLTRAAQTTGVTDLFVPLRRQIAAFVDDWCGTRPKWPPIPPPPPPPWPDPWPIEVRPGEPVTLTGADLVAIGVEFFKAAETVDQPEIAAEFRQGATRFLVTGLERIGEA